MARTGASGWSAAPGSTASGWRQTARTTRFLAFGELSGDWGGGGELGPEALWHAMRAEDGRGPETELRTAVPAHFGLARVEEVVVGVHLGKIDYSELTLAWCRCYSRVAGRGDKVARDVVLRQADRNLPDGRRWRRGGSTCARRVACRSCSAAA